MKGYIQKFHFDEELLPENYEIKHFTINSEFWNNLNRLQTTYKNCTIYINYYLHDYKDGFLGITIKLKSYNKELDEKLKESISFYSKGRYKAKS